eukprot:SAG22_NODE_10958_length_507_cov_1.634804_2_plen_86_part_01
MASKVDLIQAELRAKEQARLASLAAEDVTNPIYFSNTVVLQKLERTQVRSKALSFCCASTVFLSKTVPFRVVPLAQAEQAERYEKI